MGSDRRILVLGAGSAGSRHARNLLELGLAVSVMDTDEARARAVPGAHAEPLDLDRAGSFDGVVVATPTSLHHEHASAALTGGACVLVEKPLAASGAQIDEATIAAAADRLTVGYNLRFHRPLRQVRDLLARDAAGEVTRVRAWFGSHLADWRPAVDYRSTYSARAELGGGILLDASHELDLLVWLFGAEWTVEQAVVEHRSDLDTDVEDTVLATLRSRSGVVASIDLDAVSRPYRRGIEVVGDRGTIALDWATGKLTVTGTSDATVERADDDVADSYRAEARAFAALVEGRQPPAVPVEDGAVVVRLCDEIRRVAAS